MHDYYENYIKDFLNWQQFYLASQLPNHFKLWSTPRLRHLDINTLTGQLLSIVW